MNEDVEKAVERVNEGEAVTATPHPDCDALVKLVDLDDWHTIRQALRDQDTELQMLRAPFAIEDATAGSHWFGEWVVEKRRREKAEALLRECVENREGLAYETELLARITAHLGAEQ